MNKILETVIMLFLVLVAVLLISFTYFSSFHMMTPVEFHNEPFPVWQVGDNICYELDHTRYTTVGVEITRTYRDGIIFVTNPFKATGGELGRHKETICFKIPSTLPDGEYVIEQELYFEVNPIATRHVKSQTQPIYITNN